MKLSGAIGEITYACLRNASTRSTCSTISMISMRKESPLKALTIWSSTVGDKLSPERVNSHEVIKMMREQMDLIVEHVLAHTMQKVRIKEFVCYFKFRDNNELYIMYCSQMRIHSISFFDQGSPMIVPSGNCKVTFSYS